MDAIDQAGNAPTETEGPHQPKPSARRRKKTETEKEALRQKRLREKFGEIGVDPDEPPLPTGISINAVRFAYSEVSQLARRRKRVNAGAIAERVAHGCKLGSEVRDGLCEWIEWLRSRRYLLHDGHPRLRPRAKATQ